MVTPFVSSRVKDATNAKYHLIGAYTRYSSWTARVETVLEYFQIPYTAEYYNLFGSDARLPSHLVGKFVPMLDAKVDGWSTRIEDSLAICEFLAESEPELGLWPKDRKLRALARSACAQMHSGFNEIRNTYHTNFVGKYIGDVPMTNQGEKEIKRMLSLWSMIRASTIDRLKELDQADDGFLFGKFSIADAFFWPVLWRFRTYNLPLTGITVEGQKWMSKMWNDPVLVGLGKDYFTQLEDPSTAVTKYDNIFSNVPGVEYGIIEQSWKFQVAEV